MRQRAQLVIALGEGASGQEIRAVLDRAAAGVGKPVSVWARDVLLRAAGAPGLSSEAELDEIKRRLARIERRLGLE
jgi:hypothetical protein